MISLKRFLVVFVVLIWGGSVCALELRGTTSVNVTSDTSVNAKNIAFDDATRQIFVDSLRQYVNADTLDSIVKNATKAELSNMILSSSIDGEQTSDTSYSANITMTLNVPATREWLVQNSVPNWLPDETKQDVFSVIVSMSDKLNNWAELNAIARNEKIDINTKFMYGNKVHFEMPTSLRGNFTIALNENGWRFSDKDGILRIWK
jgi:hypothetical protein